MEILLKSLLWIAAGVVFIVVLAKLRARRIR